MAKQVTTQNLEDWLKSIGGFSSTFNSASSSLSSARAIIQAWAELRDSLKQQSFHSQHLQSLKTLINSQTSLHVADPQAKLVLSILSSPKLSLPRESYPLFLRLLYIWVKKSTRPSLVLVDSAVDVVTHLFFPPFEHRKSPILFSEGLLLLGSLSSAPLASESSKMVCLELISRLLEEEYQLIGSSGDIIPHVLAGIGYALSSSVSIHYARILNLLLGIWSREGGPPGSLSHGLMILHLMEWVSSSSINSHSVEKLGNFSHGTSETLKGSSTSFAVVMAAAGVLRTLNKSAVGGPGVDIVSRLRISLEDRIEFVARDLIFRSRSFTESGNNLTDNLCLKCFALALARSGPVSSRAPFFICLAFALLTEIFPLRRLYAKLIEPVHGGFAGLRLSEVKEHLDNILFKEAGAVTALFCNQYVSVDEGNQVMVENLIWDYCNYIYLEHRQVALVLRDNEEELLGDIEKIAESAFLMVVVFALAVTKHKLTSKFNQETKVDVSVRILISFSCLEYFRRIRLPEYMDTIRGVVVSIQEKDSACVSFVESMPAYNDLTDGPNFVFLQKMEYIWSKDEVQTARILFYLRVIPTCIERLPIPVFRKVVTPIMFLCLGHPNGKVARASHSMFVSFISSGKDANEDERVSLKEHLVFYYMQRSLLEYPGITPFEGLASGVSALVRYLPAGSPAIFYCIHSLVEKADRHVKEDIMKQADQWKNWQGESEHCKKILDLLLRLLSMVDIQVLPDLMKLLAQLIVKLPEDGQNMVLNELYSQVAESDDVTRKPSLVSWLQSLSYLCFQANNGVVTSQKQQNVAYGQTTEPSTHTGINARL